LNVFSELIFVCDEQTTASIEPTLLIACLPDALKRAWAGVDAAFLSSELDNAGRDAMPIVEEGRWKRVSFRQRRKL
jgi:hypothetical protein